MRRELVSQGARSQTAIVTVADAVDHAGPPACSCRRCPEDCWSDRPIGQSRKYGVTRLRVRKPAALAGSSKRTDAVTGKPERDFRLASELRRTQKGICFGKRGHASSDVTIEQRDAHGRTTSRLMTNL